MFNHLANPLDQCTEVSYYLAVPKQSYKPIKKNITLSDVAKELGISPATVSLALRKKGVVAAKTRQLVITTARKLGYVYNRNAAQLRTRRSSTVSLIVPNIINPFFAEFSDVVEEVLEQEGWRMHLLRTSENIDRQARCIHSALEYGVDGILICPVASTRPQNLRSILPAGLPVVQFIRRIPQLGIDYVVIDNYRGTKLATEYLLERGHSRFAFIGGLANSNIRRERFKGFQDALHERDLKKALSPSIECASTVREGYEAIMRILETNAPPTAVVCYNDVLAYGVILGLWAAKLTPGRDVAVVGFDNLSDSALWRPPLTTVSSPVREIASEAVSLIVKRLHNPYAKAKRVTITPSLVIRRSCGE